MDVELGYDWTVPWDLNKIKKSGEWPEELEKLFNVEASQEIEIREEGESVSKDVTNTSIDSEVKTVFISDLTPRVLEQLAIAVFGSRDPDGVSLCFAFDSNTELTDLIRQVWGSPYPDDLKVNLDKFVLLAGDILSKDYHDNNVGVRLMKKLGGVKEKLK